MIVIDRLDHLVLTVADVEATVAFYRRVLGMTPIQFDAGRQALRFGASQINLHSRGQEFEPKALVPTAGSADLCLLAAGTVAETEEHLRAASVPILLGPVDRTGAAGAFRSIYFRDPDGNLIEIAHLDGGPKMD